MDNNRETAVDELLDLSGRRILVTGASGNIGRGIALRLAEAGADLIVHYHGNRAAAEQVVEEAGRGDVVRANLADADAVANIIERMQPDDIVNNAASQGVAALDEMTADDWQAMFKSTLDSAYLVMQAAAVRWKDSDDGHSIVNIASIEGTDPAAGHAHYATAKAGLLMLTRAAAQEYGTHGIRINAVSPGLIGRDGIEEQWPEGVGRWQEKAPLTRLGTPNDVADAVLFLTSRAARWITGANLVVDGGMSTQSRW